MNVIFCGKTDKAINSCSAHLHSSWEIILNLTGENTSVIDNVPYQISAGNVMLIPPNVLHNGFSKTFYTDMYIQAHKLDFSDVTVINDHDGNITLLMNMLHKTFVERENNYSAISDNILDTICQIIKKHSQKEYKYKFIYDVKSLIYKNIGNYDFKIHEISRKTGYNIDYIRRCFYKEIGKTPQEYLFYLRISQAKKLMLQETFISVEDVAYQCGFKDSFYFSTCFKKTYGISPSEYRKMKLKA